MTTHRCAMLNNGRNEAVSVLDFLLQTFSNSIYLEQDVQIRINYLLLKSSRGSISFSTSIALPQPPEECHTVSAFPQTHGKLDRSPGKAAQHKRQKKNKIRCLQRHQFPVEYKCFRYSNIIPLSKFPHFYYHNYIAPLRFTLADILIPLNETLKICPVFLRKFIATLRGNHIKYSPLLTTSTQPLGC